MSKKTVLCIILIQIFIANICLGKNTYSIIPSPKYEQAKKGFFIINEDTKFILPENNKRLYQAINPLLKQLKRSKDNAIEITKDFSSNEKNRIICKLNKNIKNNEGYVLDIKKNGIVVEASTANGIFYAMQSLRQLLPPEIENIHQKNIEWSIPCGIIKDEPEFSYRGFMLDVGRHYMPVDFIKKSIEMAAFHKFNKFHWHLTEDQGWRIEIKKYPKLTAVGGYRNMTLKNHLKDSVYQWDTHRYGGFYTQEEVKEIVKFAHENFIEVIPEIEMPGHALAALAAYPEYSCSGGPFEVGTKWGVFEDIYCTREETFKFLENILDEVIALFPSNEIHIGGDEAPRTRWERCHKCQERIKELNLKNEAELQTYFINRIGKYLNSKGKKIIGWDEVIEGGIPDKATVMIWKNDKWADEATRQGHEVILTPSSSYYLNVPQGDIKKEPMGPLRTITLKQTYNYMPIKSTYSSRQKELVRGVQANLWTEYIATPEHVEYMVFPRLAAVAETAWRNPEKKNFEDFYLKLKKLLVRYDIMGINYSKTNIK